jgi:hypothetical protein
MILQARSMIFLAIPTILSSQLEDVGNKLSDLCLELNAAC